MQRVLFMQGDSISEVKYILTMNREINSSLYVKDFSLPYQANLTMLNFNYFDGNKLT